MNFYGTKYRASLTGAISVLTVLSFQITQAVSAYDVPDFEYHLFSPDGLFLEENDRESVLQALASLASNFPDDKAVDSDLREKALAVALRIAPLNKLSRNAHSALSNGKKPAPTGSFKKTTTISNTLWDVAEKMLSGKPEPEAEKLAPYLMDISLSLSPAPSPERVDTFARLRKFKLLPWDKFVTLQPDTNSSSGKIGILFSLLKMETTASRPGKTIRPKEPGQPKPKDKPEESVLKLQSASMPAIGMSDGKLAVGTLSLDMRKVSGEQRKQLSKRLKSGGEVMRPIHLGAASGGRIRITGFPQIMRLIRFRYRDWPANSMARFLFKAKKDIPPIPPGNSINFSLPGMILAHSVYSGKPVDQSLVFAGQFESSPLEPKPEKIVVTDIGGLLENGKRLEFPFLVLPESAYPEILKKAIEADKLGNLFSPQLLSFSDFDDALALATEESEELRNKAKSAFEEIEAVISQMPIEDLARNKAVRLRLQKIVDDYPRHLSARLMLDFGREKN